MSNNQPIKINEIELKDDKVVKVKRVNKVVKGGRILSFSALVVVGDMKGVVGFGLGKARDYSQAIEKAANNARKNLVRVCTLKGTIPHEIKGRHKGSEVFLKPAAEGTGVIAGGPARSVLKQSGISNVVAKSRGSNNPYNVVIATMNAIEGLRDPYTIAKLRGISLDKLFNG